MVHNGIEYGDMQLIAEAYDILKNVGGLSNEELAQVGARSERVSSHTRSVGADVHRLERH